MQVPVVVSSMITTAINPDDKGLILIGIANSWRVRAYLGLRIVLQQRRLFPVFRQRI
jgi:hypothetical protein